MFSQKNNNNNNSCDILPHSFLCCRVPHPTLTLLNGSYNVGPNRQQLLFSSIANQTRNVSIPFHLRSKNIIPIHITHTHSPYTTHTLCRLLFLCETNNQTNGFQTETDLQRLFLLPAPI